MNQKTLQPKELAQIKLNLLAQGVSFDFPSFESKDAKFVEKRWAYGNSDEVHFFKPIPQEIRLDDNIVVAVHCISDSPWKLTCLKKGYFLYHNNKVVAPVSFPTRPKFYDAYLKDGTPCKTVGTLYGGGSLGIFALGSCYYFSVKKSCGFCSLEPTRSTYADHIMYVAPEVAAELTQIALHCDPEIITQIMINGGNRNNNDIGFLKHVEMLKLVCKEVSSINHQGGIEVHLITMPPDSLELLELLRNLPVKIAMNLEVFSKNLFESVAPGKAAFYGREKIIHALEKAVDILGIGNVYTIFVGGLEPIESLSEGLSFVAERGIVPIINVFHRDSGARFSTYPRPTVQETNAMGKALQFIFNKYKFKPFYNKCGRNALDTEAFLGYF